MAPLPIGVGNDISAAVHDGCMATFAEGNLTLQFGDVIDAHRAYPGISARQLFDQIDRGLPLGVGHHIAEVPAALGNQRFESGKPALR